VNIYLPPKASTILISYRPVWYSTAFNPAIYRTMRLWSREIILHSVRFLFNNFCNLDSHISILTRRIYFRIKCMLEIVLEWNNKGCITYNCMRNFNTMRRIISVQFPCAFFNRYYLFFHNPKLFFLFKCTNTILHYTMHYTILFTCA